MSVLRSIVLYNVMYVHNIMCAREREREEREGGEGGRERERKRERSKLFLPIYRAHWLGHYLTI